MLYDRLDQISRYEHLDRRIVAGLKLLAEGNFADREDGLHEIEGREIMLSLATYDTQPPEEIRAEIHRQYLDIQCLLRGRELVGVSADLPGKLIEANEEKDLYFVEAQVRYLPLLPGQFVIFYPGEVHAPNTCLDGSCTVRKAVVKVRLG